MTVRVASDPFTKVKYAIKDLIVDTISTGSAFYLDGSLRVAPFTKVRIIKALIGDTFSTASAFYLDDSCCMWPHSPR